MRIKNFIIEQGCRKQNHASKRRIGILLTSCNKLTEKKKVPKLLSGMNLVYEKNPERLTGTTAGMGTRG